MLTILCSKSLIQSKSFQSHQPALDDDMFSQVEAPIGQLQMRVLVEGLADDERQLVRVLARRRHRNCILRTHRTEYVVIHYK